jgi:hypothetical protein
MIGRDWNRSFSDVALPSAASLPAWMIAIR